MVSLTSVLLLSLAALAHAKSYSATWDSLENPVKIFSGALYLPGLPSDLSTTVTFELEAHDNKHSLHIQCQVEGDRWFCGSDGDGILIEPYNGLALAYPKRDEKTKDGKQTKGTKANLYRVSLEVETTDSNLGVVALTDIKMETKGGNMDWCKDVKYSRDAKYKTGKIEVKGNDCVVDHVYLG
ncbi:hypothetical protein Moror_2976 [Moniliophthora roreri MCA 2997]|uniref:Uncharacterized protein n=2 Tax=Moniliophthora roreri TaxID=221103 RepID=V2YAK5_MONRO|nr:hypothetical protein Moror_2976 [Moniliophthora roreri MCA 2997]